MRRLVEVGGGQVVHDPAAVQDDDPVGDAAGGAQVVGDEYDGEPVAVAGVGEQVDEVFLGEHVQAAGGFVGEQDVRVGGHGAGEGDALALAAERVAGRRAAKAASRPTWSSRSGTWWVPSADRASAMTWCTV